MISDYFNDLCDIYHVTETAVNVGYGIPSSSVMDWPESPDETDVSCHFHVKNGTMQLDQQDPYTELDGMIKLSLPYGTDIRKNDIVVSKTSESIESGLKFRASVPRTICGKHHMTVMLHREDDMKGAI